MHIEALLGKEADFKDKKKKVKTHEISHLIKQLNNSFSSAF